MPSFQRNSSRVLARLPILLVLISTGPVHPFSAAPGREGESVTRSYAVSVSVLGLFHPREFIVTAPPGHALVLQADEQTMVLEDSEIAAATIRIDGPDLTVSSGKQRLRVTHIKMAGRDDRSEDFILQITNKIKRRYHGKLAIRPAGGNLLAVVTLDLETAVRSVVAAESAPDTPMEALKAYAIAARSYFAAGRGRHPTFDFCDTTHCQFLRSAPPPASPVAQAVEATRGLILVYRSTPFAAMYTRSCGGRTRTPVQVGLPGAAYPYYSVECGQCRQHPVRWTSNIPAGQAWSLRPFDEGTRLQVGQRLGWSAVPSNDFSLTRKGDRLLLRGVGNGHGIGLCQAGAKAMAEAGADLREILEHYYPNTDIVQQSALSPRD